MPYAYMLSHYMEDGANEPVITTDRSRLSSLIMEYAPRRTTDPAQAIARLSVYLEQSDEELAQRREGINLNDGWGGIQLHVVLLTE
jgi:hypothetical protein